MARLILHPVLLLGSLPHALAIQAEPAHKQSEEDFRTCAARYGTVNDAMLQAFSPQRRTKVLLFHLMTTAAMHRWDTTNEVEAGWHGEDPDGFTAFYSSDAMPGTSTKAKVFVPKDIEKLVDQDWSVNEMMEVIAMLGHPKTSEGLLTGQRPKFGSVGAMRASKLHSLMGREGKYANGQWLLAQWRFVYTALFAADCMKADWIMSADDDTFVYGPSLVTQLGAAKLQKESAVGLGINGCSAVEPVHLRTIPSFCGGSGIIYSELLGKLMLKHRQELADDVKREWTEFFEHRESDPHGVNYDVMISKYIYMLRGVDGLGFFPLDEVAAHGTKTPDLYCRELVVMSHGRQSCPER